jgi:hypothetical protein
MVHGIILAAGWAQGGGKRTVIHTPGKPPLPGGDALQSFGFH